MDWSKIISVIVLAGFIIFLAPRALQMVKNSPKGSSGEWQNVAMLLGGVALFVYILMKLV